MVPVDVSVGNNKVVTLGPSREELRLTQFNKHVCYHGDETGRLVVVQEGGNVEFNLTEVGMVRGIEVTAHIAPIEKDEPTTPVQIPINFKRV